MVVLVGDAADPSPTSGQGSSLALIGAYVLAGELAAAVGDHDAAFAECDRVMRPFIAVNQALGIQSAQFMTQDPTSAPVQLSGSEIERVIDRSTDRIADAANAITLKDYSAFTASRRRDFGVGAGPLAQLHDGQLGKVPQAPDPPLGKLAEVHDLDDRDWA